MKENVRVKADAMKMINDISMKGEIVVFGSTYMSEFPLYELVNKCTFEHAIYNRSISGLTVNEALKIIDDCVISIRPCKLFLSLGEEDEGEHYAIKRYTHLVSYIRSKLPDCSLYLIGLTGTGQFAEEFNKNIKSLCDSKKVRYIDFVSRQASEAALYKARFKQLSCFFRNKPVTSSEAFTISSI
ncbi:MAG: hypothetical protein IJY97_02715 [Clostridia bacterium]|nr:hypothetical protein [Clostridia bacterium]